ncbi:MAG: ABC transporter permease [Oceanospirillaceae bacterium]|nr:ABC transporter permease [Oceanospirillaceae bacterium]
MNFDFALILSSIPQLLEGLSLTFQLWILSGILGLILAIMLMLMRISGRWYLAAPAMVYIYIFRGTPILVQLFIIYYGLPQVEFIRESIAWEILREPFGCGILALTLNTGAYVSEILRGGVQGVPKGLGEAAAALGLSKVQRFIYITTPLAVRLSLPAYSNDVISLMKSTALVSTITLLDMMGIARVIVSETYAPYEIFISLMIIYLLITWVTQKIFALLERRMSRHIIQ